MNMLVLEYVFLPHYLLDVGKVNKPTYKYVCLQQVYIQMTQISNYRLEIVDNYVRY